MQHQHNTSIAHLIQNMNRSLPLWPCKLYPKCLVRRAAACLQAVLYLCLQLCYTLCYIYVLLVSYFWYICVLSSLDVRAGQASIQQASQPSKQVTQRQQANKPVCLPGRLALSIHISENMSYVSMRFDRNSHEQKPEGMPCHGDPFEQHLCRRIFSWGSQ